jgi:AcrR family transcriptional regulator
MVDTVAEPGVGPQDPVAGEPFGWDADVVVQSPASTERPRAQRVDARDNAQRILDVARRAFLAGESPSLEEIAARADVGIATLYRHFPNRESLVRAAYHAIYQDKIVPQLAPERFLPTLRDSFITISVQVIDLLRTAPTSNLAELTAELIEEHLAVFDALLDGARQEGMVRPDLVIEDLPHIIGMIVVGLASPSLDDAHRARYLSLMFDALTPGGNNELPPLS